MIKYLLMKNKIELLSPAGNEESFYKAISNGCNAIYLGLDKFSARAYATNFSLDNLKEYVDYAHLRNIKINVTMNTILFDEELSEAFKSVDKLASIGVDAIIVQDLTLLSYITNNYKSIEAHASTQVGIDDVYASRFFKDLGVKRIVFARETPLSRIKEIKDNLDIEVETFIHGALCVSYSGNCLMSSYIGERSANRGRCAGCCRQIYSLNQDDNKLIKKGYLLSLKDLNTSSYIDNMRFIDSFKIEGRMKEPQYVGKVTSIYRKIIDNEKVNKDELNYVFNREYTEGFINNAKIENISNINRPNNNGYLIGEISNINKNKVWIRLFNNELNKGDIIRIENGDIYKEISFPITKMFDSNFNEIESSNKTIIIYLDKKVHLKDKVYKTKDINKLKLIEEESKNNIYKRLPLKIDITLKLNKSIFIKVEYMNFKGYFNSEYIIKESINKPTKKEDIIKQLNKLNDTPYFINELNIDMDDNIFVPVKILNEVRRNAIKKLDENRLKVNLIKNENKIILIPPNFDNITPFLSVECNNEDQLQACKILGIKNIYYKNIVRRNNLNYIDIDSKEILIGGYGSIDYYKNKNRDLISDYSFNVVNYINVALLHNLGIKRVTLSYEIDKDHINSLINNYFNEYKTYPNLELIIYGNIPLMNTKYCPLKRLGMCGECRKHKYSLKDNYESFGIDFHNDCTLEIKSSKKLNLIDLIDKVNHINSFRIRLSDESKEESIRIISLALNKLNSIHIEEKIYNPKENTRGHFIKNPL